MQMRTSVSLWWLKYKYLQVITINSYVRRVVFKAQRLHTLCRTPRHETSPCTPLTQSGPSPAKHGKVDSWEILSVKKSSVLLSVKAIAMLKTFKSSLKGFYLDSKSQNTANVEYLWLYFCLQSTIWNKN